MTNELGTLVLEWVSDNVWHVSLAVVSMVAGVLLQVIGDRVAHGSGD